MRLISYMIFICICSCGKQMLNENKRVGSKTDSIVFISDLVSKKYDYLLKGSEIKFPFDYTQSQPWEIYDNFFNNIDNRFYIEKGYRKDINQDGIEDIILLVNHIYARDDNNYEEGKIEMVKKANNFKDSILKAIENDAYFKKNNSQNLYLLTDRISSIIPTHFIILLGEKDNTYILHTNNSKIIPTHDGNKNGHNFSTSLDNNKIEIVVGDYFEPKKSNFRTELLLTFAYNKKANDWLLNKAFIHYWSDHDIDINDYCEIKNLKKQSITNFDYNSMYTKKSSCYNSFDNL